MKTLRDLPFCVCIRRKAPKIGRKPLSKVGLSHGSDAMSVRLALKSLGCILRALPHLAAFLSVEIVELYKYLGMSVAKCRG